MWPFFFLLPSMFSSLMHVIIRVHICDCMILYRYILFIHSSNNGHFDFDLLAVVKNIFMNICVKILV